MALYSRKDYWDDRYSSSPNSSDEWYQNYKGLRHLLNPIHFAAQGNGVRAWNRPPTNSPVNFPPREACRVLIVGCGNSRCGEDMRKDGWTGPVVNLDFSDVVIDQMKERYNTASNKISRDMDFICHDVTTGLPFPDEAFDLIICKGSFDAVLCSAGSVSNIRKLVQESVRCLVPGHGVFFVVSNGNPDNRLVYLEHENDINFYWDGVSCHNVDRPSGQSDYVYICRRRLRPFPVSFAIAGSGKENQKNTSSAPAPNLKQET